VGHAGIARIDIAFSAVNGCAQITPMLCESNLPTDMIPYGRQCLESEDETAVLEVLRSAWLTTGPQVEAFEKALARRVGARFAVAVSSGTAALHSAMAAIGIGPGDEVIVPAMTFVATANAVVLQGARPVIVDVHPDTLLVDTETVRAAMSPRTRAVIGVDYAGLPWDYPALQAVCGERVRVLADACHSLGASRSGRPVGSLADISLFSFHPVKPITSGEGGALVTDDATVAERARRFRNHGLSADAATRDRTGDWRYEMLSLGVNYRLTDIQCALAGSQLGRLEHFIERRRRIASRYDAVFRECPSIAPLAGDDAGHGYHLYVLRIGSGRDAWFRRLRELGIGVNVHYLPVHLHRYYRETFGTGPGQCPVAEAAYAQLLSLPIYPAMTDGQVETVINAVFRVASEQA